MIAGLDHVNIATDRLEETRRFFVQVLGLTEGYRPKFNFPGYWLYLGEHDAVHLVGVDEGDPDAVQAPSHGPLDHFAFRVTDLNALRERLEAHAVPYRETTGSDGRPRIFTQDPNGVTVELDYHAPPPRSAKGR